MTAAGGESMTLLLSISAVERLADPGAAIEDAGCWSGQVGVVGNADESVDDVEAYVDGLDAEPDIVAGPADGSLASIRQRVGCVRQVLVTRRLAPRVTGGALGG
jgi:hypothetical protein